MKEGIRVVHLKPSHWARSFNGPRHLATRAHYTLLVCLACFLAACATPPSSYAPPPDRVSLSEHILLAEIARARGEPEQAGKQYAAAMAQGASLRLAREATHYGVRTEHWPHTLSAARRWAELDEDSTEANWYLGISELMAGDQQAAVEALSHWLGEQAVASDWQTLVHELQGLPRRWRAWEVVRELAKDRDSMPAQWALARMAMDLDRLDDAARHARRGLRLDGQDPALEWLNLRIRLAQGRSEAKRALGIRVSSFKTQDIYGAGRDRTSEALELVTLLWEQDRVGEAAELLSWGLSKDPGALSLQYALALVEIHSGELDAAQARLQQLLNQGFRVRQVWLQMGIVAEEQGHYREAIRWYDRIQSGEDHIEARARVIALLFESGQTEQARERLEVLESRMLEERHGFRVTTGAILAQRGPSEVGQSLCRRALDKRPWDAEAHYQCALGVLAGDRHNEQAVDWLRRAYSLWPEEANVLNALGYSLADQDRDLREARRLIRQALRKRPDNGPIMDSMGWVAYRQGDMAQARRWLERAWERTQSPEIAAHLMEIRWVQGERTRARKLQEAAIERWPENMLLRETWERLQES
ncbi:tetratricopeptide (TPR) repeat protein [Natronospira proteinivora]|uniref:Tetratricopeptide (TPR) repeat protein n=1 Tax=Natronospira proteinivora TaxID=1807133 RepID=A0ABT1G7R7_9GAMM|nr:tetratricopeptide repeat protein [Natronospira proteinivora]MCP1727361.1 tetratricopeptide (TPR) repeat protein [Natronospira proteinivora]